MPHRTRAGIVLAAKCFTVICLVALSPFAHAAAPIVTVFSATSVVVGEYSTLHVEATDPDGDLHDAAIVATGPGIEAGQTIFTSSLSGASAAKDFTWRSPQVGAYNVVITVKDAGSAQGTKSLQFEVFSERKTLQPVTITDSQNIMYLGDGELRTAENTTSPSTVVQKNGALILWSAGRIVLKPGFTASKDLTLFWAAVDHNRNGYSDVEEATDSDADGMFDAWEVDHHLDMTKNDANLDKDGDGTSNLNEFLAGRDPFDPKDGKGVPSGFDIVLKGPSSYWGVNTANWTISSVAAP